MKFLQGKFRPQNPKKYKGKLNDIVYRSSWELATMVWLDRNDKVVEWSSEETVIPYLTVINGIPQQHRYFPDFWVKFKRGNIYLVEVKPQAQMVRPKERKIKSRKYLIELATYNKNLAKWQYAMNYCRKKGWTFEIWSEEHLYKLGIIVF